MGVEEEIDNYSLEISINENVLIQLFFIGFVGIILTAILSFYHMDCIIVLLLSIVFGFTICFLGIYFLLISKPLFKVTILTCKSEDDDETEFQSTMKIE